MIAYTMQMTLCYMRHVNSGVPVKSLLGLLFGFHGTIQEAQLLQRNSARLISEVSREVATQMAKNCRRQQPHSHLRLPSRPLRVSYTLLIQSTCQDRGLHFRATLCVYRPLD